MTGGKEATDTAKRLCTGNRWEFGGRREAEGAKGEILKQWSRRLTPGRWKRGGAFRKGNIKDGLSRCWRPRNLQIPSSRLPLEMCATHRGFVCPAALCFRGEAEFFVMEYEEKD